MTPAAQRKSAKFQRAMWPTKAPATAITPGQHLEVRALDHRLANAIAGVREGGARARQIRTSLNGEVRRDNRYSLAMWFSDWRLAAESECRALETASADLLADIELEVAAPSEGRTWGRAA